MPSYNVFLSSTFADFAAERKRLRDLLPFVQVNCICTERVGDTGNDLTTTLIELIDDCEIVVLLIGSRAGTRSGDGDPWTQKEVKYALKKKKRVFAYIRDNPKDDETLVDRDSDLGKSVDKFKDYIQKKIALVPRYQLGECCKLTAMVIRDVDRCAEELKRKEQDNAYMDSFQ